MLVTGVNRKKVFKVSALGVIFAFALTLIAPHYALAGRSRAGGGTVDEFSIGDVAISVGMSVGAAAVGQFLSGASGAGSSTAGTTGSTVASAGSSTLSEGAGSLTGYGLDYSTSFSDIGSTVGNTASNITPAMSSMGGTGFNLVSATSSTLGSVSNVGTVANSVGPVTQSAGFLANTANSVITPVKGVANLIIRPAAAFNAGIASFGSFSKVATTMGLGFNTYVAAQQVGRAIGYAGQYHGWDKDTTFLVSSIATSAVAGALNPEISVGGKYVDPSRFSDMGKGFISGAISGAGKAGMMVALEGDTIRAGKEPGFGTQVVGMVAGEVAANMGRTLVQYETWHVKNDIIYSTKIIKPETKPIGEFKPAEQLFSPEDLKIDLGDGSLSSDTSKLLKELDPLYSDPMDKFFPQRSAAPLTGFDPANVKFSDNLFASTSSAPAGKQFVAIEGYDAKGLPKYGAILDNNWIERHSDPRFERIPLGRDEFMLLDTKVPASEMVGTAAYRTLVKAPFIDTFSMKSWPSLVGQIASTYVQSEFKDEKWMPILRSVSGSVAQSMASSIAYSAGIGTDLWFGTKSEVDVARRQWDQAVRNTGMERGMDKTLPAFNKMLKSNLLEWQQERAKFDPQDWLGLEKLDQKYFDKINRESRALGEEYDVLRGMPQDFKFQFIRELNVTELKKVYQDMSGRVLSKDLEDQLAKSITAAEKQTGLASIVDINLNLLDTQLRMMVERNMSKDAKGNALGLSDALKAMGETRASLGMKQVLFGLPSSIFESSLRGAAEVGVTEALGDKPSLAKQILVPYAMNMATGLVRGIAWHYSWDWVTDKYHWKAPGGKDTLWTYAEPEKYDAKFGDANFDFDRLKQDQANYNDDLDRWNRFIALAGMTDKKGIITHLEYKRFDHSTGDWAYDKDRRVVSVLILEDKEKGHPSLIYSISRSLEQANMDFAANTFSFFRPFVRTSIADPSIGIEPQQTTPSMFANYVSRLQNIISMRLPQAVGYTAKEANIEAVAKNIGGALLQIPGVADKLHMQPERLVLTDILRQEDYKVTKYRGKDTINTKEVLTSPYSPFALAVESTMQNNIIREKGDPYWKQKPEDIPFLWEKMAFRPTREVSGQLNEHIVGEGVVASDYTGEHSSNLVEGTQSYIFRANEIKGTIQQLRYGGGGLPHAQFVFWMPFPNPLYNIKAQTGPAKYLINTGTTPARSGAVDEGSTGGFTAGNAYIPAGLSTPQMPSFSTNNLTPSYFFPASMQVNNAGFTDAEGSFINPTGIAFVDSGIKNMQIGTAMVSFTNGLDGTMWAATGKPIDAYGGDVMPKFVEAQDRAMLRISSNPNTTVLNGGRPIPMADVNFNGFKATVNNLTYQTMAFLNENLIGMTDGKSDTHHTGELARDRGAIRPLTYGLANVNNDIAAIYVTPENPYAHFSYSTGAYAMPGDNLVGSGNQFVANFGTTKEAQGARYDAKGGNYALMVNPQGMLIDTQPALQDRTPNSAMSPLEMRIENVVETQPAGRGMFEKEIEQESLMPEIEVPAMDSLVSQGISAPAFVAPSSTPERTQLDPSLPSSTAREHSTQARSPVPGDANFMGPVLPAPEAAPVAPVSTVEPQNTPFRLLSLEQSPQQSIVQPQQPIIVPTETSNTNINRVDVATSPKINSAPSAPVPGDANFMGPVLPAPEAAPVAPVSTVEPQNTPFRLLSLEPHVPNPATVISVPPAQQELGPVYSQPQADPVENILNAGNIFGQPEASPEGWHTPMALSEATQVSPATPTNTNQPPVPSAQSPAPAIKVPVITVPAQPPVSKPMINDDMAAGVDVPAPSNLGAAVKLPEIPMDRQPTTADLNNMLNNILTSSTSSTRAKDLAQKIKSGVASNQSREIIANDFAQLMELNLAEINRIDGYLGQVQQSTLHNIQAVGKQINAVQGAFSSPAPATTTVPKPAEDFKPEYIAPKEYLAVPALPELYPLTPEVKVPEEEEIARPESTASPVKTTYDNTPIQLPAALLGTDRVVPQSMEVFNLDNLQPISEKYQLDPAATNKLPAPGAGVSKTQEQVVASPDYKTELYKEAKNKGIDNPSRFSTEVLRKLVNNLNGNPGDTKTNAPLAVVVGPKADYNGAFSETESSSHPVTDLVNRGYRVMYGEIGEGGPGDKPLATQLIQSIPALAKGEQPAIILLEGHGEKELIRFGDERSMPNMEDAFRFITVRRGGIFKSSGLSTNAGPETQIVLYSCSAGEGGEKALNIANLMREIFSVSASVWAPKQDPYGMTWQFDSNNQLTNVVYGKAETYRNTNSFYSIYIRDGWRAVAVDHPWSPYSAASKNKK